MCGSETVSLSAGSQSYLQMRNPGMTVNLADVSTFFTSDNVNCPVNSYQVMTVATDLPASVYGDTDISVLASN